jgi:hypothetical protein
MTQDQLQSLLNLAEGELLDFKAESYDLKWVWL